MINSSRPFPNSNLMTSIKNSENFFENYFRLAVKEMTYLGKITTFNGDQVFSVEVF